MTNAYEELHRALKQLPGLGHRSAEKLALHLLLEKPERLPALVAALQKAAAALGRCEQCGNLSEGPVCAICADPTRVVQTVCVVECVPDLLAIERAGSFRGLYHVLHGKLSPMRGIGPNELNLANLTKRVQSGTIEEFILALPNDIEGESTCHYIQDHIVGSAPVKISRIGFGLPSGANVVYADAATLKSALDARRDFH